MNFDFNTARRIIFGSGKIELLGEIIKPLGNKPLLISGSGGVNLKNITEIFHHQGLEFHHYRASGEPTIESVQQAVDEGKTHACDLVIGLGGGSSIDTAKAVAALLTNPGDVMDYLEVIGKGQPLINPPFPFIAIPTTAGTGSEVTKNAVLKHNGYKVKVSLRHPLMLADVALLDPDLTLSVPPPITASTGMDALTQLLEPYVSIKANPMTDMFCREGLPMVARSLLRAFQDGNDIQARTDMAWASLLGGLALANAGLGAAHGFAGPMGGMFPAPHGAICAALLPAVVKFNLKAMKERENQNPALRRYQEIAAMLIGNTDTQAEDLINWLQTISKALSIPRLGEFGLTEEAIPDLVKKAAVSSSMKGNPIKLSEQELSGILINAL